MKLMTARIYMLLFLLIPILLSSGNAQSENELTLTRMEIPKLELDIEVKRIPFSRELGTWDITEETGAVYWLEGTSHPEYGGNTVIAAHYMEYGEPGPLYLSPITRFGYPYPMVKMSSLSNIGLLSQSLRCLTISPFITPTGNGSIPAIRHAEKKLTCENL